MSDTGSCEPLVTISSLYDYKITWMHYFVGLGDSKTENSTGSSLLGDLDDLFSAVTQQNSVSYKISFCRLTLPDCQIMITLCSQLLNTEVLTPNSETLDTT